MANSSSPGKASIVDISNQIIKRLEPLQNSSLRVMPFPDDPKDLQRPSGNRLLVGFKRENFERPQTLNPGAPIVQLRLMEFELVLQVRDLRTQTGAESLIDDIRELVTGFCPSPVDKPLFPVNGGFVDVSKEGLWTYSLTYGLQCRYEKFPNPEDW